jgi:hypothetical protein
VPAERRRNVQRTLRGHIRLVPMYKDSHAQRMGYAKAGARSQRQRVKMIAEQYQYAHTIGFRSQAFTRMSTCGSSAIPWSRLCACWTHTNHVSPSDHMPCRVSCNASDQTPFPRLAP